MEIEKEVIVKGGRFLTNENKFCEELNYIQNLIADLAEDLNIDKQILMKVLKEQLKSNMKKEELNYLISETSAVYTPYSYDYSILAARVLVKSLYKRLDSFSKNVQFLYKKYQIFSKGFYDNVIFNAKALDEMVCLKRDYQLNFFSYKTLEKSYLIKCDGQIHESPQYMYMRVAVAIGKRNLKKIKKIYTHLSKGYISFATPTLFNAGAKKQQLASCFLIAMKEDSLKGIYDTLDKTAQISKYAGGIGVHIHNIRAKGTPIKGTNGVSNGIIPMLKVFNESSKYVDQGGGKRKGSIAVYLEPWHRDIEDFLGMRKPTKPEQFRCLDLFTALWIPDLFMERVIADDFWTLFCPSEASKLSKLYGKKFNEEYIRLENDPHIKSKKVVKAKDIMMNIIESQIHSGTPYMLYKDSCNQKSNQKNVGTIESSNLCTEIIEYSDSKNTAVCNLGSIALPKFVKRVIKTIQGKKVEKYVFNFKKFSQLVKHLTYYLNEIIEINDYPTEEAKTSNLSMRPIGIGVQGLADVFFQLSIPYSSEKARELNKKIFEVLYYSSLSISCSLAKKYGPYEKFEGSPASKGILQFDMWNVKPSIDFSKLKQKIKKYGLRNSLLVALMPTASTAQILGNTESFEPQTSNLYKRQTLSGEYLVVNKYLINDLKKLGLWNQNVLKQIIRDKGSVYNLSIPDHLKDVYRTVREIKQKFLIDMAADRAPYICQSQSMNLWFITQSVPKIYSAHIYGWRKGLKTGSYYVHTDSARDAVQVTTDGHDSENCLDCSA